VFKCIHVFNITDKNDKTAAIFCHQVAAWITDMLCNLFLVNIAIWLIIKKAVE
jgi:hypothetical protein